MLLVILLQVTGVLDNPGNAAVTTLAVGAVVKILVDVIKGLLTESSRKFLPIVALTFGVLFQVAAVVADGGSLTIAVGFQSLFTGILAGAGAIGATELQKKVSA